MSSRNKLNMRYFLAGKKVRAAYVITHRLADVDAYCSAYALARLIHSVTRAKVRAVIPEGLNAVGERVSRNFPMQVDLQPDFAGADLITIVDTNNPALLSDSLQGIIESRATKLLVDHHPLAKDAGTLSKTMLVDTAASSTSEMIHRIYAASKVRMSRNVAQAILVGIMADSQHLFLAGNRTIEAVNDLCKHGASLEAARKTLARERDISERIARLKTARRASLYRAGDFVVAVSHVGSFHASAAKGLLDLGADLSAVISEERGEAKASLRATVKFHEKTGIHLGTDIASKLSGRGGGHPTAASLTMSVGEGELEKILLGTIRTRLGGLEVIE